MSTTVHGKLAIKSGRGRQAPSHGDPPTIPASRSQRVPRVARLMALAIRFDQLIRDGVVADYADLARLGHVSRARVTQIMNLLNLAPDIQEQLLCSRGDCRNLHERRLRVLSAEPDWRKQRQME